MIDYIKLHFSFLYNQLIIISIFILEIICIIGIIYASNIFNGYAYMDSFRQELEVSYFNETFIIIEIILIVISIFIATILQTKTNNYLMFYATYNNKEKLFFIIAKIIVGIIVIGIIILINYLAFKIILDLTPYIIKKRLIDMILIYLFIEALQMFCITLFLLTILNHIFISILPIIMFWYLEAITNNQNKLNDLILMIFININPYLNKEQDLSIPLLYILIIIFNYIYISYKKDC